MKKVIEKYKEIKDMPKGNAYLFFGFYFIFFLILIIFFNMSPNNKISINSEREEVHYLEMGNIMNNNYHYEFRILVDDKEYIYSGNRNKDREMFYSFDKEYYCEGNSYYEKNGNEWSKIDSPFYYAFMDLSRVSLLLEDSYLESETIYKSGKDAFRYFLDTNRIYQILYNQYTDYDDSGNSVVIYKLGEEVDSIIYLLDGYCKSGNLCHKSLKIEIHYDNIGKIDNINRPF